MKKRGLSAVITTLIIILLVLVAVGVVWVVIANLITTGSEEISLGKFTINMQIQNVEVKSDDTLDVTVKRNPGKGDLVGIKFLVSDGVEVQEFEEATTIGELGQQTFNLPYDGLVKDVSIAPIFELDSGKESMGNEVDSEEIPKKKIIENLGGVSWWRFEGSAQDEIGDNDGTISGANCNAQGKFGRACSFDGTDDYIDAGTGVGDFEAQGTVAMWVNLDSSGGLFSRSNGGGWPNERYVWNFYHSPDNLILTLSDSSTATNFVCVDKEFPMNEWVHSVVTHDGSEIKFYQNGELVHTATQTRTPEMTGIATRIGRIQGLNPNFADGQIDEVMIFNKALSEDEVKALYELDLS